MSKMAADIAIELLVTLLSGVISSIRQGPPPGNRLEEDMHQCAGLRG